VIVSREARKALRKGAFFAGVWILSKPLPLILLICADLTNNGKELGPAPS
jgi:hypothetical protein